LKLSFTHPITQSITSRSDFKADNLSVNTKDIPLLDKINLHKQTGELIYNDISKISLATSKTKDFLMKVTGQLKLEKANSRSLHTQNE